MLETERRMQQTRSGAPAELQLPYPFPEGWYFVASRREVGAGEAVGQDLDGRGDRRLVRRAEEDLRRPCALPASRLQSESGGGRARARGPARVPVPRLRVRERRAVCGDAVRSAAALGRGWASMRRRRSRGRFSPGGGWAVASRSGGAASGGAGSRRLERCADSEDALSGPSPGDD